MTVAIILAIGCYVATWLYTARALYGRWRAKSIDKDLREFPLLYRTTAKAIESWNDIDRLGAMPGALALALLWPVIPAFLLVVRFMDGSPVLSQAEMRDRIAARDKRIAELEREAGITPGGRS